MTRTIARTTERPVSEILREAREELGLSVEEVASQTRIPRRYVEALEEGSATTDAYTRIYMKAYGKFLGIDASRLVARSATSAEAARAASRRPSAGRSHPLTAVPSSRLTSAPRIIRVVLGLLVVAGVVAYFAGALQRLVAPPPITLFTPQDGMVTSDRSVTIEGRTESEVLLTINGKVVGIDSEGRFSDAIALQEGVNVIRVVGNRKHSKDAVVERRVIVKPRERRAASLDQVEIIRE